MDGLTIKQGQAMIDTGKRASELRSSQFEKQNLPNVGGSESKTFADTLKDAVGTVNQLEKTSDLKMQELATGKTSNIPEVMMAAEKADIAFRMMVQMRNKIIEAYQEVMKMQV